MDRALEELADAGLIRYDDETSTVLIINAVKYLPRQTKMNKSVVNDVIYNNTPLAEELLKHHPYIRTWEEWTEEAQFTLDSRNSKEGWDDDGAPF